MMTNATSTTISPSTDSRITWATPWDTTATTTATTATTATPTLTTDTTTARGPLMPRLPPPLMLSTDTTDMATTSAIPTMDTTATPMPTMDSTATDIITNLFLFVKI